ncbi:MAG TPA: hypothetical protein VIG86_06995 [Candidatus Dormibacteraeota bacterium]|jgi:hypothetical protein
MPRRQQIRGVKVCARCGEGYDAFKAMEVRGRYCSPSCLASARAARRHHIGIAAVVGDAVAARAP